MKVLELQAVTEAVLVQRITTLISAKKEVMCTELILILFYNDCLHTGQERHVCKM